MPQDPQVLQFGSGVFLRGFFDWMLQRLHHDGRFDGRVVLSKLTPGGSLEDFARAEGRFVHVLRGVQDGEEIDQAEPVDRIAQWLHPFEEWSRFLRLAELPSLQIVVSNSTEAGIRYEAQDRSEDCPATFPARLAEFLLARYRHFKGAPSAGLVHLPCELIEDNGQRLQEIVLRHAEDWDLEPGFRAWIEEHCPFVDTLVDRIVTPLDDAQRQELAQRHGVEPGLMTASEPYSLFVLRGDREAVESRLPLAASGLAVWTDDLPAWRDRKVRVLNGAHTAMVGVGVLSGVETVLECTRHPALSRFIRELVHSEIVPALPADPAVLRDYADQILERFQNPFLHHRLSDIGLNSLSKAEVRLFPTLRDLHRRSGRIAEHACFALAALLRYLKASQIDGDTFTGEHEGRRYAIRDEGTRVHELQSHWVDFDLHRETGKFVERVLGSPSVWSRPVIDVPGVSSSVARHLASILEHGTLNALDAFLETG